MRVLGAFLTVVVLAAGPVGAQQAVLANSEADPVGEQGYITREWTWSDGTATTTFTAYGPSAEVMQIDPRAPAPFCNGCELASSVQFEPSDDSASD